MSRWMSSSTPKQNSRRHKKGGPWGRPSIPRLNLEPSNLSRLVWVDFRGCLWISPACWLAPAPLRKPRRHGGADALHPGPGCPAAGGGEPADHPPHPDGSSPPLLWSWRSGGCLGLEAAAAMNASQTETGPRGEASSRTPAGPWSHRRLASGSALPGLLQTLPVAVRRWLDRTDPPGCSALGRRCHRVTYESSNRPGSSNGHRPPPSYRYRKHEEAALKIRRDFMG